MASTRAPILLAAAFVLFVIVRSWGLPPAVFLFTTLACAAWAATIVWALRLSDRPFFRFFHSVVVLAATAFWAVSETLGIRVLAFIVRLMVRIARCLKPQSEVAA
jgi:hypothetical protein